MGEIVSVAVVTVTIGDGAEIVTSGVVALSVTFNSKL
jgi:predicted RecA/RadA family phage recombinase